MEDEVAAYCLDRAVMMFGKTVENDIQEKIRDEKSDKAARTKAVRLFGKWMAKEDEAPRGVFRDPMAGR